MAQSDQLKAAWDQLAAEAVSYQALIRNLRVVNQPDPVELRDSLAASYDFSKPVPIDRLTDELITLLRNGLIHVTHPSYYGLYNPTTRPAAVLGDTLAALYNPQLAVWSHAPVVQELERLTLGVLGAALGYDSETMAAHFTSGGAEANLVGMLLALADKCPAVSTGGLRSLTKQPVLYISAESHHSFVKAARMAGLGTDAVREVPVDDKLAMDSVALETMIADDARAGFQPFLVVGTAGTTSAGVIDPLPEIAEIARRHDCWFHADAAWGGAASLSSRLKPLLSGIEQADSITWDAHKWLSVPMGGGMVFSRHPEAMARAFSVASSYMPPAASDVTVDPHLVTPQWSRRSTGLKVFCALAELGLDGYERLIDHQTAMGNALRQKLTAAGWEVVNDTPLPVICFTHPKIIDGTTTPEAIRDDIYERGTAWISAVHLTGKGTALRACITSYLTNEEDLDELVQQLTVHS